MSWTSVSDPGTGATEEKYTQSPGKVLTGPEVGDRGREPTDDAQTLIRLLTAVGSYSPYDSFYLPAPTFSERADHL